MFFTHVLLPFTIPLTHYVHTNTQTHMEFPCCSRKYPSVLRTALSVCALKRYFLMLTNFHQSVNKFSFLLFINFRSFISEFDDYSCTNKDIVYSFSNIKGSHEMHVLHINSVLLVAKLKNKLQRQAMSRISCK